MFLCLFATGAVGGSVFHFIRGAINSPRNERLIGAVMTSRARAPIVGGSFAVWGGIFAIFDCSLVAIRRKV